ncbi:hypothetical protein NDU88_003214 [Pleurodeles waltl]|uniref:Uncharacterized protein n=1 Tax=Pleurodeles waltl TaxID=8319 RepID=A0AAV7RFM2_PLEWA|nr:hypothetical protein NDU88_003214 [Pleurodeles waltl]
MQGATGALVRAGRHDRPAAAKKTERQEERLSLRSVPYASWHGSGRGETGQRSAIQGGGPGMGLGILVRPTSRNAEEALLVEKVMGDHRGAKGVQQGPLDHELQEENDLDAALVASPILFVSVKGVQSPLN